MERWDSEVRLSKIRRVHVAVGADGLGGDGLQGGRRGRREEGRGRSGRKERTLVSCAPCGLPAPAMMEMASPWLVWEMASTSSRSEDGAPRVARIGGCTCQGRGGGSGGRESSQAAGVVWCAHREQDRWLISPPKQQVGQPSVSLACDSCPAHITGVTCTIYITYMYSILL